MKYLLAMRTVVSANGSGCQIGNVETTTLRNPAVNGTSVSFDFSSNQRGGNPTGRIVGAFSGTVSGNRMSGVVIGSGDGEQTGTFAVTRQ